MTIGLGTGNDTEDLFKQDFTGAHLTAVFTKFLHSSPAIAAEHVTREHPCNFEPSVGFCGWQQPDLGDSVGESGLVEAASAPHGGPPVDANPGMGDGEILRTL